MDGIMARVSGNAALWAAESHPNSAVRQWIESVHKFRQNWTDGYVPPDVRSALNETEQELKISPTTFSVAPVGIEYTP